MGWRSHSVWGRSKFLEGSVGWNMDGGWVTSHTVYIVGDIIHFSVHKLRKKLGEADGYLWYTHSLGSWGCCCRWW